MNIQELQTSRLDINNRYDIDVTCKQLDNIILKIIVYDKSIAADLSNYKVRFKAFKNDQVPLIQNTNITISNNVVIIKASEQLTTTSGIVKAELQFINKNTLEKKSTFYINIEVVASVLDEDGSISTATCTLLKELDNKLNKIEDIGDVLEEAKTIREELKSKIPIGNTTNNTLNTTIKNANDSKAELDKSKVNSDNSKIALDKSTNNADTKKSELETTTTNAETKKQEIIAECKVADKKIEDMKSFGDVSEISKDVKTLKEQALENTCIPLKTDSTLTKLENCRGGFVRNMQIKGRTLQNLWDGAGVGWNADFNGRLMQPCTSKDLFKQNTTYTVINYSNKNINFDLNKIEGSYSRGVLVVANSKTKLILNNEVITFKIGQLSNGWENSDADKNELKKSIMILEGEVKEIPQYFEGIKSTGELEGNKISILSKSKNLLDTKNGVNVFFNNSNCSWDGYKLIVNTGETPKYYHQSQFELKLYQGVQYKINYKSNVISGVKACDIKATGGVYISGGNEGTVFTVPKTGTYYINFYCTFEKEIRGNVEYTDITLVANSNDVIYVEPKTDKTEILLKEPLMGIPNVTADIADVEKNERINNVGEIVLNENNIGSLMETNINTLRFVLNIVGAKMFSDLTDQASINILCNYFNCYSQNILGSIDIEGISSHSASAIQLRISKSKLSTPDIAGLKKWLQANPVTVFYQLATPTVEKLEIKDTLQTFEDGYIQLDNAITPSASLEYSTNIPSVTSKHTELIDKLVDNNINISNSIKETNKQMSNMDKNKANTKDAILTGNATLNGKQLATVDDTGWIDLTPFNNVKAYYDNKQQIRRNGNIVYLKVVVTNITSTVVGFSIPSGFRPRQTHRYTGLKNGWNSIGISIETNGNIEIGGVTNPEDFACIDTVFYID